MIFSSCSVVEFDAIHHIQGRCVPMGKSFDHRRFRDRERASRMVLAMPKQPGRKKKAKCFSKGIYIGVKCALLKVKICEGQRHKDREGTSGHRWYCHVSKFAVAGWRRNICRSDGVWGWEEGLK